MSRRDTMGQERFRVQVFRRDGSVLMESLLKTQHEALDSYFDAVAYFDDNDCELGFRPAGRARFLFVAGTHESGGEVPDGELLRARIEHLRADKDAGGGE